MPFENNMNQLYLSSVQNKIPAVDVNTSFLLPNGDGNCTDSIKNAIKNHLMNYGAVATSITMKQRPTVYYNELTNASFRLITLFVPSPINPVAKLTSAITAAIINNVMKSPTPIIIAFCALSIFIPPLHNLLKHLLDDLN